MEFTEEMKNLLRELANEVRGAREALNALKQQTEELNRPTTATNK